uniref:Uncharacterized protein n=1 Tax=Megaselia scalaris TaxID=36166 RepID=T1GBG1_MEGSC
MNKAIFVIFVGLFSLAITATIDTTTQREKHTLVKYLKASKNTKIDEYISNAYKQIIRTHDRIYNAGYDELQEINNLIETLSDPCKDIQSFMHSGTSKPSNPQVVVNDTLKMCNLILKIGIPKNNNDLETYMKALTEL